MVRFEVIRDLSKPGAQEVADWIRSLDGVGVRVASTEVFEDFQVISATRAGTKTAGRGEQAAAEVLSKELASENHGAILLFEDSDVRKQNFLVSRPDEVLVISTSEFLFGLEAAGLLPSAEDILQKATAVRGNEIPRRTIGGTASGEMQTGPARMQRSRP